MQKSIWKLAALAGVVGISCLVVLQAQRGLTRPEAGGGKDQARFEDFDSAGSGDGASDTSDPASVDSEQSGSGENTTGQTEIGFAQYEPAAGSDRTEQDSPGNQFADNLQPDPFAAEADEAVSNARNSDGGALSGGPRFPAPAGADSSTAGGLDFRGHSGNPPATRSQDADNPFAVSPSDESGSGMDIAPRNSTDETSLPRNPFAGTNVKEIRDPAIVPTAGARTGNGSVDATDETGSSLSDPAESIRRSSHNVDPTAGDMTTAAGDKSAAGAEVAPPDNPFADDGPNLYRTSDNPQADGGADSRANRSSRPRPLPIDAHPDGESPFGENPATNPPLNDAPPPEPFPSFERNPMPRTATAPQSSRPLLPGPAAFGEPSPTSEAASSGTDSGGSAEPFPAATTSPGERVGGGLAPGESTAGGKLGASDAAPSAEPDRLAPAPKAVRLVPPTRQDLSGDGTIDESAPVGPRRPQLNIVKQAPKQATLGQPLIYSILVQNVGSSPAHQVIVEDRIPKRTRLTGTIPQAEMFHKKLLWKLGTLKPNEQRKIQVRVVPIEAGQIGSIATVNFVAEVASRTLITAPSLKLELAGPDQTEVGRSVTFRFKVTNDGTSNATGVVLRNLMPAELKHPGGNDLEYEVGTLPAGKTREVSLTVAAVGTGSVLNKAVVTADGDLTADASARLRIDEPALEVTRSGPNRHFLGRSASFVIRVTNKSTQPIGPLTVVETIPAGVDFVTATDGGQYNAVQRTVAWRIDRMLVSGESQQVTLELTARATGVHTGSVTAIGPGGRRARIEARTEVVGLASLGANVSGVDGPVAVGETVSLKVRVSNRGNAAASGVRLQIALPDQLTFVSSDGPVRATAEEGMIRFQPLPTLGAGKEATLTVVLQAARAGDARLNVLLDADHMSRPIGREEAIVIFADGR